MWYLIIALVLGSSVNVRGQQSCIAIFGESNCPQGTRCVNNVCRPDGNTDCSPNNPCPNPRDRCIGGRCVRDSSNICSQFNPCPNPGDRCQNGICVPGRTGCSANIRCRDPRDICVEGRCIRDNSNTCSRLNPCPNPLDMCQNGVCVPGNLEICSERNPCRDPRDICQNGRCVRGNLDTCSLRNPCRDPRDICQNGRCVRGGLGECSLNLPCPSVFERCENGRCVPAIQGEGCIACQFDPASICENNRCVRRLGASCQLGRGPPCSAGHTCIGGICSRRMSTGCNPAECDVIPDNMCEINQCVRRPGATCQRGGNTLPCSSGYRCRNGVCTRSTQGGCNPRQCDSIRGSFCEGNECVRRPGESCQRGSNSQSCSSGYRCRNGVCTRGSQTGGCFDCGFHPGSICENDRCVRQPGATCGGLLTEPCSAGFVCREGFCSNGSQTGGCFDCGFNPGSICENDRCVRQPGATCGGLLTEPCSAGFVCREGFCSNGIVDYPNCISDQNCRPNERCRRGTCVPDDIISTQCNSNRDCRTGFRCENYICVRDGNQPQRCSDSYPCPVGQRCRQGTCIRDPTSCSAWIPCPGGQTCRNERCETGQSVRCDPVNGPFCERGYRCRNSQCVRSDLTECNSQRLCQPGYRCRMGNCVRQVTSPTTYPSTTRCQYNRDCPAGHECIGRGAQAVCIPVIV